MRSLHVDEFNHDDCAKEYDEDVKNEQSDPVRTGYEATLQWVVGNANLSKESRVLELGSGTGNLTRKIEACGEIVCVDISTRMEQVGRPKLSHLENRSFIVDDILEVLTKHIGFFDTIISTYTAHHLIEEEKKLFFKRIWDRLLPGGVAVFGDLMLDTEASKKTKIDSYRNNGDEKTAIAIEEEFFWIADKSVLEMEKAGFDPVDVKRFSDLSYGIKAKKPAS